MNNNIIYKIVQCRIINYTLELKIYSLDSGGVSSFLTILS